MERANPAVLPKVTQPKQQQRMKHREDPAAHRGWVLDSVHNMSELVGAAEFSKFQGTSQCGLHNFPLCLNGFTGVQQGAVSPTSGDAIGEVYVHVVKKKKNWYFWATGLQG